MLRRRSRAGVCGGLSVLLAVGAPAFADGGPGFPVGSITRDVTYCKDSGIPQKLDLLYPTINVSYPRATVLWVHGGTWSSGSKDDATSSAFVQGLRRGGFIVASMNYALAPAHKFPAQTQDLTCGVRFLRAKAAQYGVDSNHIGTMGGSAGGHLVQMLGVNNGSRIFVDGGYPNFSSSVQAVVSLWGVSDLTRKDLAPGDMRMLPSIFGMESKWAAASPISYVRQGLPPFLFVHGKNDSDVPISQSKRMYRALLAQSVPATIVPVQNGEHGLRPSGGPISPSIRTLVGRVVDFFTWAFKRT